MPDKADRGNDWRMRLDTEVTLAIAIAHFEGVEPEHWMLLRDAEGGLWWQRVETGDRWYLGDRTIEGAAVAFLTAHAPERFEIEAGDELETWTADRALEVLQMKGLSALEGFAP